MTPKSLWGWGWGGEAASQQSRGWTWDNPSRLEFLDMQNHITVNTRDIKVILSQGFFPETSHKNIPHCLNWSINLKAWGTLPWALLPNTRSWHCQDQAEEQPALAKPCPILWPQPIPPAVAFCSSGGFLLSLQAWEGQQTLLRFINPVSFPQVCGKSITCCLTNVSSYRDGNREEGRDREHKHI